MDNTNTTSNASCDEDCEEEHEDPIRNAVVRSSLVAVYSVVLSFSIVSNLFVVLCVLVKRRMRTVTNIFVANLACADVLMCMFSGLFTPIGVLFIEDWTFGALVCKLIPTTCTVSVFVISWTSTLIAAERYWSIVRPHARKVEVTHATAASVTVWFLAAAFTVPIAFHQDVVDKNNDGASVCKEDWGDLQVTRAVYTYACLTVQYLLPALLITFAYSKVLLVLDRRLKVNMSKVLNSQRENKVEKLRQKQRVTRILLVMIAAFMVCWVPLNVFNMLTEHKPQLLFTFRYGSAIFIGCHLMASVSTVLNAVLYAGMNYEFRRQLRLGRCSPSGGCFGCCQTQHKQHNKDSHSHSHSPSQTQTQNMHLHLNAYAATKCTTIVPVVSNVNNNEGALL